ncbi:MAG TPA: TolC family outer membrane protein, partial [Burkholderiales bacterium]|nr:TolC family outer membrane protein [Burkholderiales bacterium]
LQIHRSPSGPMMVALRSLLFALPLAVAMAANGADLMEIYRMAQSADAQYAAARATWSAGQEKLPQGLAGLLPSATVSASTQQNDRETRSRDPAVPTIDSRFNSNIASISITQPLYRPQNVAVYDQARSQVLQSDAVFAQATQDLILRVAQAYFDVLLAQDTVVFAQAQLTAIGRQLEQAKRNFEVGTATITDTHEAQSRYDLTVSLEIVAKNELEVRKRLLELIIGRPAPGISPLGPRFSPRFPEPDNPAVWVGDAAYNNLGVRISQANLDFATKEIERNRAAHRPTLDAFATYTDAGSGTGTTSIAGVDTKTGVVGVQLAIPIYQGGLTSSRVREAIANEEKARQDLENARRTAELTAQQTYLGVASGISQVKALEAALVSSQSSLDSTRLGQEVGVRTQIDVLNAQQQLSQTRRDLAQAKYNYILSLLRLKASAGQLTEQDVALVNGWLDR